MKVLYGAVLVGALMLDAAHAETDKDLLAEQYIQKAQILETISAEAIEIVRPIVLRIYEKKYPPSANELTNLVLSKTAEVFEKSRAGIRADLIRHLSDKFSKAELEQMVQLGEIPRAIEKQFSFRVEFDPGSYTFKLVECSE